MNKTLFFFTSFIIVFPGMVNFVYTLSGHQHRLYDHYFRQHIDHPDIDCNLQQFHYNPALDLEILHCDFIVFAEQVKHFFNFYEFIDIQYRLFELRAPPFMVA